MVIVNYPKILYIWVNFPFFKASHCTTHLIMGKHILIYINREIENTTIQVKPQRGPAILKYQNRCLKQPKKNDKAFNIINQPLSPEVLIWVMITAPPPRDADWVSIFHSTKQIHPNVPCLSNFFSSFFSFFWIFLNVLFLLFFSHKNFNLPKVFALCPSVHRKLIFESWLSRQ